MQKFFLLLCACIALVVIASPAQASDNKPLVLVGYDPIEISPFKEKNFRNSFAENPKQCGNYFATTRVNGEEHIVLGNEMSEDMLLMVHRPASRFRLAIDNTRVVPAMCQSNEKGVITILISDKELQRSPCLADVQRENDEPQGK